MTLRVLNLYAGVGGNRKLWKDVDVTAVEYDPIIAAAYAHFFPHDHVVVGDAHQYLLENFMKFDFIWSSPPCPTHSQYRFNVGVRAKGYAPVYPDMTLWQEIIFLKHHFKGKWVVENVKSNYEPLVPRIVYGRHYVWSNFKIVPTTMPPSLIRSKNKLSDFDTDLSVWPISNKRQVLRNMVDPSMGLSILNQAFGV
jgi:DNA (cytosine-5)-methyltransferase 1